LGRKKVSYWKPRQEITWAIIGASGFILLVNAKVYGYPEVHGLSLLYFILAFVLFIR
jgi:hypothetical protein